MSPIRKGIAFLSLPSFDRVVNKSCCVVFVNMARALHSNG